MPAHLEAKKLVRRYGSFTALDELSFNVPAGSTTAFIGANGAGKTTTFSIIAEYIKANSGEILIDKEDHKFYRKRGGIIGLLPQGVQFYEDRKVHRQLFLFARLSGMSATESQIETNRVLNLMSLTEKRNEKVSSLSQGMKIRLAIAQTLIGDPPILILDEPTAGLDPKMVQEFRNLIERLRGSTTILISSHVLSELENLCDHVIIIDKGKLVKQGPLKDLTKRQSQIVFELNGLKQHYETLIKDFTQYTFEFTEPKLTLKLDQSNMDIAKVNREIFSWCITKEVDVLSISSQKSLENTYFKLLNP